MYLRLARQSRVTRSLKRTGFTLMEMMVVVAIIVALAGIGIFFLAPQADEGSKTKVKADIKSLDTAVGTYKTQHAGMYPENLQVLMVRDEQGYGPYIRSQEDLLDPWNRPYNYDPSGTNNGGLKPDIWCDMPPVPKLGLWTFIPDILQRISGLRLAIERA